MGALFRFASRSRRAARRSAPTEFAFAGGLVGRHLRGRRFLGGSSVPLCQPFSVGGSEIRPYRIRFCRGLGRAASPRPPLSRWELSSALPAVLSGRLGDPPLPNSLLPGGWVGRHLRGRRYPGGSSVPLCQPFSVGGSEIRPY